MPTGIESLNLRLNPQLGAGSRSPVNAGSKAVPFDQALQQALKAVSQTQKESSQAQIALQTDKEGASIEQTMISMQRSNVAFTAAVTVRNKMVSAYSEIMNMQV